MLAVDTDIIVYLLVSAPHTAHARALLERDADWHTDASALFELTNVLATAVRVRGLSLQAALLALSQAQSVLEHGLHIVDDAEVLVLATRLRISAYDARFLVAASNLGLRLVTEDVKLRKAAPAFTQSLAEALAAA